MLGGLPVGMTRVLVGVTRKKSLIASGGQTVGVGLVAGRPKYVTSM